MKTLSRFRAKSISGSGDIDRGHKKSPPPPPDLQGSKKLRLNRVKSIFALFVTNKYFEYLRDEKTVTVY